MMVYMPVIRSFHGMDFYVIIFIIIMEDTKTLFKTS